MLANNLVAIFLQNAVYFTASIKQHTQTLHHYNFTSLGKKIMSKQRRHIHKRPLFQLSLCAGLVATVVASQSALAQSAPDNAVTNDTAIEQISVIGSRRIGRTVEDSSVPIDIIDSEALTSSGLTETNMVLSTLLPSFNFPQPSITDGTDHVRPAQLRGLAPDHTLVLINGKRRHTSALLNLNGSTGRGSSAVDLNAIPVNAIKRIEVLRDGAAAQYGSDAIAGVINIVLKDADNGGSMSVTYGANATTMDGVPSLTGVSQGADGKLAFTEGSDRKITDGQTTTVRGNIGLSIADNGFLNVSGEYRQRNATNRADYDQRENYARLDDNSLDPRELTVNRYNHNFGNGDVTDLAIFYNAGSSINANMDWYSFGSYSSRTGEGSGFYRRAQDARNVTEIYPDGFLPTITSKIADYSLAFGVKGIYDEWDYDLSAVYGSDDFNFGVINSLNTSLGPTSPTEFDAGTLIYEQFVFNADASRLYRVDFFASDMNLAIGAEYRREDYAIEAGDSASFAQGPFGPRGAAPGVSNSLGAAGSQVFPGFTTASASNNSRENFSAYIDLEADVTEMWNVAVAARFEDYSDFGSTFNWKVSNRLMLTDAFSLRGSISTGFRAPSLQQQFFTSIATVFVDGEPTETGTFSPSSKVALALGSPGLDAEESTNMSVGFSFAPSSNFNLTVDFYEIDIDDRIVLSSNLSGAAVEELLAGTGATRGRFFLNAIDSTTKGFDIVSSYNLELDNNSIMFSVGYNQNDNEVTRVIDPPALLQGAGVDQNNLFDGNELRRFEVGSPDEKLNLSAIWTSPYATTTLRTTRYGETQDPSDNPLRNEVLPGKWITDLDVNYPITEQLSVSLGANNILDVYPDTTRELVDDVTDFSRLFSYSGFSPFGFNGRYVYGQIRYTF